MQNRIFINFYKDVEDWLGRWYSLNYGKMKSHLEEYFLLNTRSVPNLCFSKSKLRSSLSNTNSCFLHFSSTIISIKVYGKSKVFRYPIYKPFFQDRNKVNVLYFSFLNILFNILESLVFNSNKQRSKNILTWFFCFSLQQAFQTQVVDDRKIRLVHLLQNRSLFFCLRQFDFKSIV